MYRFLSKLHDEKHCVICASVKSVWGHAAYVIRYLQLLLRSAVDKNLLNVGESICN
jgi:hypothetical protein